MAATCSDTYVLSSLGNDTRHESDPFRPEIYAEDRGACNGGVFSNFEGVIRHRAYQNLIGPHSLIDPADFKDPILSLDCRNRGKLSKFFVVR